MGNADGHACSHQSKSRGKLGDDYCNDDDAVQDMPFANDGLQEFIDKHRDNLVKSFQCERSKAAVNCSGDLIPEETTDNSISLFDGPCCGREYQDPVESCKGVDQIISGWGDVDPDGLSSDEKICIEDIEFTSAAPWMDDTGSDSELQMQRAVDMQPVALNREGKWQYKNSESRGTSAHPHSGSAAVASKTVAKSHAKPLKPEKSTRSETEHCDDHSSGPGTPNFGSDEEEEVEQAPVPLIANRPLAKKKEPDTMRCVQEAAESIDRKKDVDTTSTALDKALRVIASDASTALDKERQLAISGFMNEPSHRSSPSTAVRKAGMADKLQKGRREAMDAMDDVIDPLPLPLDDALRTAFVPSAPSKPSRNDRHASASTEQRASASQSGNEISQEPNPDMSSQTDKNISVAQMDAFRLPMVSSADQPSANSKQSRKEVAPSVPAGLDFSAPAIHSDTRRRPQQMVRCCTQCSNILSPHSDPSKCSQCCRLPEEAWQQPAICEECGYGICQKCAPAGSSSSERSWGINSVEPPAANTRDGDERVVSTPRPHAENPSAPSLRPAEPTSFLPKRLQERAKRNAGLSGGSSIGNVGSDAFALVPKRVQQERAKRLAEEQARAERGESEPAEPARRPAAEVARDTSEEAATPSRNTDVKAAPASPRVHSKAAAQEERNEMADLDMLRQQVDAQINVGAAASSAPAAVQSRMDMEEEEQATAKASALAIKKADEERRASEAQAQRQKNEAEAKAKADAAAKQSEEMDAKQKAGRARALAQQKEFAAKAQAELAAQKEAMDKAARREAENQAKKQAATRATEEAAAKKQAATRATEEAAAKKRAGQDAARQEEIARKAAETQQRSSPQRLAQSGRSASPQSRGSPGGSAGGAGMVIGFGLPDESVRVVAFGSRKPPLGMDFKKGTPVEVRSVHPGSHAHDLGVGGGWTVVSVNGQECDGLPFLEVFDLMKKASLAAAAAAAAADADAH